MRNLIAFYLRFRIFLVFVVLQGIALYLYFTYSDFPRLQFLTSASSVNAKVLSMRNNVTKHFQLSSTNKKLIYENRFLRSQITQSLYKSEKGIITIHDTSYRQQYTYIPANVINSTLDKRDNYMTIDAGTNSGIRRGMGVISSKGVVGVVHNVSKHFSVVKTVLSKNINIDVMLEDGRAFGLLKWDGKNAKIGNVNGISNDMQIKKWGKIITRGGSGIFPKGIPVGKVSRKKIIEGRPLWDIWILYTEDFRKIQHVYIIQNLLFEEQKKLEEQIPKTSTQEEL